MIREVKFQSYITLRDFQELNLFVFKSNRSYKIMLVFSAFFVFLFISMIVLSLMANEPLDLFTNLGLLLIAAAYFFGLPFLVKYNAKRIYQSNKTLQEPINFTIDSNQITAVGETYQFYIEWNKLYKLTQSKNSIYFFQSKQNAMIIPKRDLSSDQIKTLREIASLKKGFTNKL